MTMDSGMEKFHITFSRIKKEMEVKVKYVSLLVINEKIGIIVEHDRVIIFQAN